MASPGASNWANCCVEIPKGGGKGGRRIALAGEDSAAGVKYRGWYQLKSQDKPGDLLQLHFRLDPSAPRNSVVQNVDFLTTEDREALIARQEMLMSQRLSTAPAASIPSCSTTTPATRPNQGNNGHSSGGSSGTAPAAQARCDELLARLTTAADGKPMQLLQLRGSEVPRDVELYFCQRTFTVLQVRPKMKITSLLHDYGVEPHSIDVSGKGGVYDFQCQRSAHHLEVKVQPPLGLQSLLSETASSESAPRSESLRLLTETLPALLALYHVLAAFQQDPTRDKVPCREACEGVPHLSEKLVGDAPVLQAFLDKCQVFQKLEQAPAPTLLLLDASRPKSRGKLLKALFEVKVILMSSVRELQSDSGVLADTEQNRLLQGLVTDLTRRCCVGGLAEQHRDPEESFKNLRLLFCGDSDGAAKEEATATLRQCQANCRNSVLPNLEKRGVLGDLREPNLEMNDSDSAVNYKHAYNRVWRAAVQTYLFSQVTSEDYEKGWQVGLRQIRFQWAKPDAALRRLQPSEKLEEAIEYWDSELELILADLSSKHGLNHLSTNNTPTSSQPLAPSANPRGSVGLDNPGENLCATNSLLQFLFSAENFRGAILEIPKANGSSPVKAPTQLYTTLEQESRQLATALNTLFGEMSDAKCSSTSAREVARVLYGGELGEQQDPDELMHRISSLLQDGLEAIPGDPFASLRKGFQRLFMGATYEVQVRREVADGTACDFRPIVRTLDNLHVIGFPADPTASNKQFLCIPVQGRNETLTQALEDFTSWAPTGGSDVVWIQEQFRTMPPYLCFATRQVSRLEWEESLNLTRFATRATPEMQRDRYELSKLQQCKAELQDSIENLRTSKESLAKAAVCEPECLKPEVEVLEAAMKRLSAHADAAVAKAAELAERLGDGFEEPSMTDFLSGVEEKVVKDVVCGLLGADTVKKLADLVFDGDENGNDTLDQLVQSGTLARSDEEVIAAKLQDRWKEHRTHMYDVCALVIYQGTGHAGHYTVFVRQSDGTFLCFDDERVTEHPGAGAVKAAIAQRSSEAYPASVRMIVYQRRGGQTEPVDLDLQTPGACGRTPITVTGADDAKRRRIQ